MAVACHADQTFCMPACLLQVLLMFGPEYARSCGIAALEPLGIFLPGDKNYPGAAWLTQGWPAERGKAHAIWLACHCFGLAGR